MILVRNVFTEKGEEESRDSDLQETGGDAPRSLRSALLRQKVVLLCLKYYAADCFYFLINFR